MAALAEEADAVAEAVRVDALAPRAQECVAPGAVAEAVPGAALEPRAEECVATARADYAEGLVAGAPAAKTQ